MKPEIKRRAFSGKNPIFQLASLDPVLQKIYAGRGVETAHDLETGLDQLLAPQTLDGLTAAVDVLEAAVRQQQRIAIVGDFDADGATSTVVMIEGLRALGVSDIRYFVPNRFEYGYGLTPGIVALAAECKPDLIITVDNGVSSIDGVNAANERGIKVLVTDHHLPGDQLPAAAAMVNPNLMGNQFKSKNLAGVGVAFYVLLGLRARLRETGWLGQSRPEPNLAELLDLVALGTVADVVPLDKNNRILVRQGLARIRAGHCRPGISALIQVSRRDNRRLIAADLGFCLGPRLNAAGRLDDMSIGIECLLTQNTGTAQKLAQELDQLNLARREIETDMQMDAMRALDNITLDETELPTGLCLYEPGWHQGVIGILAARIRERFNRPVIAFADSDNGEIKGSARSVPGIHIRDVLYTVAKAEPDMLNRFGGHAMAAGMTLKKEHYSAFSKAFNAAVLNALKGKSIDNILLTDGSLTEKELTLNLAENLRNAGPWGQHFPEPTFDGIFTVQTSQLVAEKHLKLVLRQNSNSTRLPGHCL